MQGKPNVYEQSCDLKKIGICSENLSRKCTFSYRIEKPVYLKVIIVK